MLFLPKTMYKNLTIENFRGFPELKISQFARVNLIAGRNSSGKTALLEALFMQSGPTNPTLALLVYGMRGSGPRPVDADEMWGWLFHNRDRAATFQTDDSEGRTRKLTIRLTVSDSIERQELEALTDNPPEETTAGLTRVLQLDYDDGKGNRVISKATLSAQGMQIQAKPANLPTGLFLSARSRVELDDVDRYGRLVRMNRQDEVLQALKLLEPRLKRLEVLPVAGAPAIFGDVGLSELVPLPLLGEGLARLLAILAAIAATKNGVALIDEIENGLHYSVMEGVWTAIGQMARRAQVQVFATTHSLECIRAAHRAFQGIHGADFLLHRLELTDGRASSVTYSPEVLSAALDNDLEVR